MKSFIRIKEIHGHKYAYEITPYYDRESKRIRQKSKYLGKYEDGKIKRMNYSLPRRSLDYGEFLPFLKCMEDLKLDEILYELLPEDMVRTVLVLALNRLVYPVSMDNIKSWYERTYLSELYGELRLSSQTLSNFLSRLGDSDIGLEFSEQFTKILDCQSGLIFDITSLSSASTLIDILEYGYNRDGDSLPQMNLSIVAHKGLGIPVFYDIYPGSIVDVSTLHNTILKLKSFGIDDVLLILDRGFFSTTNLSDLRESNYDFVIPGSFANKRVKSLVHGMKRHIEKGRNLARFNGHVIFVKASKLEIGRYEYQAYVYYSPERESSEKINFYGRLHDIIERLENRYVREWEDAAKVVEDIAGNYAGYFKWKLVNHRLKVTVKEKAVSQRVNRMGFMVLIHSGKCGWKDALAWYREKDVIEKMFKTIKNDIATVPLRAQKTTVAKGLVFINFIALILRFRLLQIMKDTDLIKEE
jgi:transposase